MSFTIPYIKRALLLCLVLLYATRLHAQQEQRYNRFQYHNYHWRAYHCKSYHLYFPAGDDSLAAHIGREMHIALAHIKKNMLAGTVKDPNIIIYPSTDQQYETNIGSYDNQQYTLPTFIAKGERIVLAYNGSYEDLDKQLYEALARSVWESQLKEDGLEEQAQGTAPNNQPAKATSKSDPIPAWFREGAIQYFAAKWPIQAEDALRNSFQQNNFTNWQQVLDYEPKLGGQAFCYFLTERYQPMTVAQLFVQLKKKKSLPRVARLVTKHTLDSLYTQCLSYYTRRFQNVKETETTGKINTLSLPHKKGILRRLLISPDQDYIAYVVYTANKRSVYIYNTKTKEAKKVSTYLLAPWIDDHKADIYPLMQWHPGGRQLFVAMPEKGKINISRYNTDASKQETIYLYGVDGITSLQAISNDQFVFTAYRQGQSDIIGYDDRKRYQYHPYTEDSYDDSHPVFSKDQQLYYSSDRPLKEELKQYTIGGAPGKDTLWQGIYTIADKQLKPLITDTVSYIRYDKPQLLGDNQLLFTHTRYGTERYATLNTGDPGHIQTLAQYRVAQYLPATKQIAFYKADRDSIYLSIQPVDSWIKSTASQDTSSAWLTDYLKRRARERKEDSLLNAARDTSHTFLSEVLAPHTDKKTAAHIKDSTDNELNYNPKKTGKYILQMQSAYFTAKVNNDYFINRYQPFLNYQGQFKFPEIGGMAQGGFTDLLENHHFTLAYRIPAGTDGSDFFIRYENTAKKTDWGLSYYRSVQSLQPDPNRQWVDENGQPYPNNAKVKTHYYEVFAAYPLSYDCSVGLQTALRKDRTIFLATDRRSLDFAAIQSIWSVTTLSFKLNKLQPTLPYLYKGFYVKALTDVFKGFSQQEALLFGSGINLAWHQPLYKYITLVTQLHAGYSGGDEKVLYNLGGEDNNVTPKMDTNVHFPQNAPYAFQTLVTPFRGYYQNTIYGNQYTLANADLYFPIFQTLIPLETPLPSVNNLQLGMFADAANARETWNSNNPNNSKWLYSYGFSARTSLAGYPLRIDVAWPGGRNAQPVWYFSLNLQ